MFISPFLYSFNHLPNSFLYQNIVLCIKHHSRFLNRVVNLLFIATRILGVISNNRKLSQAISIVMAHELQATWAACCSHWCPFTHLLPATDWWAAQLLSTGLPPTFGVGGLSASLGWPHLGQLASDPLHVVFHTQFLWRHLSMTLGPGA